MTGKQIAANLRKSRRRWGRLHLFQDGRYCVLGLKARESGIPNGILVTFCNSDDPYPKYIIPLLNLNDACRSKQGLISLLNNEHHAKHVYPVERFIKFLKANAKKYTSRRAK